MSRFKLKTRFKLAIVFLALVAVFSIGGGLGYAFFFGGTSINLQKGLVGHWKMDGNAHDSTPNAYHGTVNGASLAADRKGKSNKAYSFNGTADDISMGDVLDFTATDNFTLSFWINSSTTGVIKTVIGKSPAATDGYRVMTTAGNALRFRTGDGVNESTTASNNVFIDGTWHHFVVTKTSASVVSLFRDGVANSTPGAHTYDTRVTAYNFKVGEDDSDGSNFTGVISDVRVYNRILATAEITALYESYNPGVVVSDLQKNLAAWWKFDGTAQDSTPNNNDGAVTGATLTTDRKGQSGKAYNFDGTDYIQVNDADILDVGTGDFSYSFWANGTWAVSQVLLRKFGATPGGYQLATIQEAGTIRIYPRFSEGSDEDPGHTDVTATGSTSLSNNTWYFIAVTHDRDGNMVGYLNGTQDFTPTDISGAAGDASNTINMFIGAQDATPNQPFTGTIDDVRLYKRVLSPTEVTALYESYNPGVVVSDLQKGLVGYWDFGAGSTTTATPDRTPNNNDGNVTGATLITDRKGQSDKAYDFNGTSDYAEVTDNVILDFGDTSDFTISGWFNRDTSVNDHVILAKRNSLSTAADAGYIAYIQGSDDKLYLDISDGTDEYQLASTSTFTATGWNFFVAVWDQDSAANSEIYINGVADSAADTGTIGNVGDLSNAIALRHGSESDGASYFDGKLDDVRVYNRALSATEILALYETYR